MRGILAVFCTVLSIGAALADSDDLVTAPNAILCVDAQSIETATVPAVAKSQTVLRAMGCMRSEAGIRTRVVSSIDGLWLVRFYPAGMSGGVTLWARPSAFTTPGGIKASLDKHI